MWKTNQATTLSISKASVQSSPAPSSPALESPVVRAASLHGQSTFGKGLKFKGNISGSADIVIDGSVEGSITLPENRVIVGKSGQVTAAITARDVVAMGRLWGKVTASGRVDIRSESIVSCDISAARMSMEDGAIFNGSIDIREAAIEVAEIEVSIADVPERSGARLGFAPALELAS